MRLEGTDAERFLESMERRESTEEDAERRRFLDECDRAYQASQKQWASS